MGPPLFRLLGASWRVRRIDPQHFDVRGVDGQHPVYVMWHESIPSGSHCHRGRGLTVLISQHGDGELITRIIEAQGYRTVRGSTSKGGSRALRALLRLGREECGLVLTPDGPRGPAHTIAPGTLYLAAATGRPVVPVGFAASRFWRAGSWDGMVFPKPFARVAVAYGQSLVIPRQAARDDHLRRQWEQRLAEAFEQVYRKAWDAVGGEREAKENESR